jgi:hypothetical protein
MSRLLNDGSAEAPKLRVYLNLDNLTDLRPGTLWPGVDGLLRDQRLAEDGFEGVQLTTDAPPPEASPLPHCGLDRINTDGEADGIVRKHAERGDSCITVHAGWGIEDDNEVFRLVESILAASDRHALPVFIETHRSTITQDVWRTVRITREFPEVRFNVDFSHYYCGQEMVYGNWEEKLAFMEPIFSRTGFMHGRIASPGCMQVPIGPNPAVRPEQAHGVQDFLAHFRELWTRAMQGFLSIAGPGDLLVFAPELLAGTHYYARLFPDSGGRLIEESDRYAEALLYQDIARECFSTAESNVG